MIADKTRWLLVANRGEIACRIFQTAKELGFQTAALMAPGDESARHITYADRVLPVSSYLDAPAILTAAQSLSKKNENILIHPGYGFLSERAHFVEAVEKQGHLFLGPRADSMAALGEKIAAKKIAEKAKVPTLPWAILGSDKGQQCVDSNSLKAAAKKVGYPLLLKASAGGGGKGMRLVQKDEELVAAAESATAEAKSAFGDGTLFLERYVAEPRHIEVQVFGDGLGGGVHLHERECSLQRRHQKVWEEATAIHLSQKTKDGLFEAALRLVAEVKYRSAGTLEFLVDENESFYFLEMNTRLQVEHPVTELVTGVDLVRLQIEQALSPKSAVINNTPVARGHAIEVRIYAEDPAQGYVPTPGRVESVRWPMGVGIRVDSGIEAGQVIGTQFDSMLGKLIVFAPDRAQALARMRWALEETVIMGLGTNQAFLLALCKDEAVISGKVHTGYLAKMFTPFEQKPSPQALEEIALLRSYALTSGSSHASSQQSNQLNPWSHLSLRGGSNG